MTLLPGSGKAGRKEDDREELDFQFDEEIVTPKHNRSVNSISLRGKLVTRINNVKYNDKDNSWFLRILVDNYLSPSTPDSCATLSIG